MHFFFFKDMNWRSIYNWQIAVKSRVLLGFFGWIFPISKVLSLKCQLAYQTITHRLGAYNNHTVWLFHFETSQILGVIYFLASSFFWFVFVVFISFRSNFEPLELAVCLFSCERIGRKLETGFSCYREQKKHNPSCGSLSFFSSSLLPVSSLVHYWFWSKYIFNWNSECLYKTVYQRIEIFDK